jgi:hypothetical protein
MIHFFREVCRWAIPKLQLDDRVSDLIDNPFSQLGPVFHGHVFRIGNNRFDRTGRQIGRLGRIVDPQIADVKFSAKRRTFDGREWRAYRTRKQSISRIACGARLPPKEFWAISSSFGAFSFQFLRHFCSAARTPPCCESPFRRHCAYSGAFTLFRTRLG